MVSGGLIEQIESALLTENQLCSVGKTEFLSYMNMFRVMFFLLVGVMFFLLMANSLGTDLTSLLKELSQKKQGKIFLL